MIKKIRKTIKKIKTFLKSNYGLAVEIRKEGSLLNQVGVSYRKHERSDRGISFYTELNRNYNLHETFLLTAKIYAIIKLDFEFAFFLLCCTY